MASGIADADPTVAPEVSGRGWAAPLAAVEALRPYQWVKNLLLFLPLVMAHQWSDADRIRGAAFVSVAFVAFSLAASSAYVLNDLRDIAADRRHPIKRNRPFASGRLTPRAGVALGLAALIGAFALSLPVLPPRFTVMLGLYVVLTLAYSFYFKQKLLVDVFLLAGLYTHRVLAGGAAVAVPVSPWLLAFCIFFFLSLAFAKRYVELRRVQGESGTEVHGRAYQLDDLEVLGVVGPTSGYIAVLVLALYVNSSTAETLYRQPAMLWMTCPLILYWLTRVWFLARRRVLSEDPLLFSLKDRTSLLVAAAVGTLIILATRWPKDLPF